MDVGKATYAQRSRRWGSGWGEDANKREREIYKIAMGGWVDYVIVGKKWIFDLLELYYKQSNGQVLDGIWSQVKNVTTTYHLELVGVVGGPGRVRDFLLGKNDVVVEEGRRLPDG